MRQIKFRALTINGDCVYGLLAQLEDNWYISNDSERPFAYHVRPDTIGEFTGLLDKNGVELYEDDIVTLTAKFKDTDILTPPKCGVIKYNQQGCCYHIHYELNGKQYYKELSADVGGETYAMTSIEKIGNRFENPELLNQ